MDAGLWGAGILPGNRFSLSHVIVMTLCCSVIVIVSETGKLFFNGPLAVTCCECFGDPCQSAPRACLAEGPAS